VSQSGSDPEAWRRMNKRSQQRRTSNRSPISAKVPSTAVEISSNDDMVIQLGPTKTNVFRINSQNIHDYLDRQKGKGESDKIESNITQAKNMIKERSKSIKEEIAKVAKDDREKSPKDKEIKKINTQVKVPGKIVVQPKNVAMKPHPSPEAESAPDKWAYDLQPTLIPDGKRDSGFGDHKMVVENCWNESGKRSEPIELLSQHKIGQTVSSRCEDFESNSSLALAPTLCENPFAYKKTKIISENIYKFSDGKQSEEYDSVNEQTISPNSSNTIQISKVALSKRDRSFSPKSSNTVQIEQMPPNSQAKPSEKFGQGAQVHHGNKFDKDFYKAQDRLRAEQTKVKNTPKNNNFFQKHQGRSTYIKDNPNNNLDDTRDVDSDPPGIFTNLTKFISGFLGDSNDESESGSTAYNKKLMRNQPRRYQSHENEVGDSMSKHVQSKHLITRKNQEDGTPEHKNGDKEAIRSSALGSKSDKSNGILKSTKSAGIKK